MKIKIAIINSKRKKGNMVHCKINEVLIYKYTTDGENDPIWDMYQNLRTGNLISSIILFETNWASKKEIEI